MTFPAALPVPRTPDPMLAPPLRWGILGPGWIAERFVQSLQRGTRQSITAVASRSIDRAAAFGARFDISRVYGSYEALVADPDVDVVYVSTVHNTHYPCAMRAIQSGKHTLVEKPLALNATEVQNLTEAARQYGVFCMEAFWTAFLPKYDVLRQILADGLLGEVKTVLAELGEHFTAEHRIMRTDLAGGPLLDLGTYPIAFATWVLGPAERVQAAGQLAASGVNGQAGLLLEHAGSNQSVLHTTLFSNTPTSAAICGTSATAVLEGAFYAPGPFRVVSHGGRTLDYQEEPVRYAGLAYEAAHLAQCVQDGRLESPIRPLADSLATIQVIDEVRHQLGIVFEEETPAVETQDFSGPPETTLQTVGPGILGDMGV